MGTYAVYFSPTGTSRRSAMAVAEAISDQVIALDMTVTGRLPEKTEFDTGDIVVFGGPVYGGRLYRGALERFSRLHGSGTTCIVTVTYGNRHYDDALQELADLAKKNGFIPAAGAALVGQHTYGQIQVGRPDASDMEQDADFARRVKEKLKNENNPKAAEFPGRHRTDEGGKGGAFRPLTNERCTKCGLCVRECPEQAISYEDFAKIDDARCISCFRCIRICPVSAKNMDTEEYNRFAADFSKRLSARRENEYFL